MAVVMPKRKKHSARRGGRLKKRAVTLPNARRRDEIVEEITENLRPWKNHKGRDTVTAAVNTALARLLRIVPFEKKFFDPRPARKHAKKLDKAISKVESLVESSPGMLLGNLFDPTLPLTKADDDLDPTPYKSLEECFDTFFAELKRLRKVCALDYYGPHPNYDPAKHESAKSAYFLMRKLSDGKITGTKDQAFRIITALLYEAVSGQQGADLKRACDIALRRKH
jgi:hypothetical protein